MSRNVALSAIFLMIMGGTGFALPDWVDIYDFYDAPGSGSLDAASGSDIHDATPMSSAMPHGGFGPPTASFQNHNGISSAVQPRPALQFKDRWLFDFASAARHPHHQQRHRRQWVRGVED